MLQSRRSSPWAPSCPTPVRSSSSAALFIPACASWTSIDFLQTSTSFHRRTFSWLTQLCSCFLVNSNSVPLSLSVVTHFLHITFGSLSVCFVFRTCQKSNTVVYNWYLSLGRAAIEFKKIVVKLVSLNEVSCVSGDVGGRGPRDTQVRLGRTFAIVSAIVVGWRLHCSAARLLLPSRASGLLFPGCFGQGQSLLQQVRPTLLTVDFFVWCFASSTNSDCQIKKLTDFLIFRELWGDFCIKG
jgi:hypothetical protein